MEAMVLQRLQAKLNARLQCDYNRSKLVGRFSECIYTGNIFKVHEQPFFGCAILRMVLSLIRLGLPGQLWLQHEQGSFGRSNAREVVRNSTKLTIDSLQLLPKP